MSKYIARSAYWGQNYNDETESLDVTFYDRENKQVGQLTLGSNEYEKTYDTDTNEVDGTCLFNETKTNLDGFLDPEGKGNVKILKILVILREDTPDLRYVRLVGKDDVASFHYP